MRRREVVGLICGAAARPLSALAVDGRAYRLGVVVQSPRSRYGALFDELRRSGFAEADNLIVDPQGFGTPTEQLDGVAAEVARAAPDVIFCAGDAACLAVQRTRTTLPIVVLTDDIIRTRLAASLARPGGNITGVTIFAPELDRKRFEILLEMIPGLRRVGVLADPHTTAPDQLDGIHAIARARGLDLSILSAATTQEIVPAIEAAASSGVQALSVLSSAFFNAQRGVMIEAIARSRLPAMYQWPEYAKEGALIAYGPRLDTLYVQAARILVKVLRGASPAEIPAEQPTQFELAINERTSAMLKLTIPPTLLARADEVIE